MDRASGILLSISSLPSPYGIGTFGKAAYDFADFLHAAGQKYWQMLPLGPTSYGDSPYQSFSSFAGNPYFIDLDMLIEDGLLTKEEVSDIDWGDDPEHVDYGKIYNGRFKVLKLAKDRGFKKDENEVLQFAENNHWVNDYALFMACKRHFEMKPWMQWPDEGLRKRAQESLAEYREKLKEDLELFTYIQFLFYKQWEQLKEYIHLLDIKIIGDVPIYVALDSADVWSEPEEFLLDDDFMPEVVSGCPPDAFSAEGQLWGNPIYDWEHMEKDGFGWWIRRIDGISKLYDVIRVDHFRGFADYWSVPANEKNAVNGKWNIGPGMKLVGIFNSWFSNLSFIAEDLGAASDAVVKLLEDSGWPGMKILEFAFNAKELSSYLPHCYERNCVCYVGTHDNEPVMEWKDTAPEEDVKMAEKYLNLTGEEGFAFGMIRGGMGSVANLFIAQMQDYLNLGKESRMNTPSSAMGNWTWRMGSDAIRGDKAAALVSKIREMVRIYGR